MLDIFELQDDTEKAVRVGPSSAEAHQTLASVLYVVGEAERAVAVARRAIELNPNYAEAQMALGMRLAGLPE